MNPGNFPPPPPEYANTPNLWRLACELSKFKDPYKAADALLALTGPILSKSRGGGGSRMSEKADTIGVIVDMLQQMDMRELELVWRFVFRLSDGKGAGRNECGAV